MCRGGSIGIFPEGGSHDQTKLLPLKPGVAVMSMCAMLDGSEDITIVPVGLNYTYRDAVRSDAILEVGQPFEIPRATAERYEGGDRKIVVEEILTMVEKGMNSVILTAHDWDEHTLVKLCASLYIPDRVLLNSEKLFKLTQCFSTIFAKFRHTDEIKSLCKDLTRYQEALRRYPIKDNEVWRLKLTLRPAVFMLFRSLVVLCFSVCVCVPVFPLWGPIWGVCFYAAHRHRVDTLKESKVKITGIDVIASYKILVAMVLTPTVNCVYGCTAAFILFGGLLYQIIFVVCAMIILPFLYWLSIRGIESILPQAMSLRHYSGAILKNINEWRYYEEGLLCHRSDMQVKIRDLTHSLATRPELCPHFLPTLLSILPRVVLSSDNRRLASVADCTDYFLSPSRLNCSAADSEIL
eukprot:GHVR01014356.1.p1 GENE.GHVR01014356.1~~GHVR01014356.1.p1  ORF type:complete len:408 (-),score=65.03 GHVR01014356.1:177-1400(-)